MYLPDTIAAIATPPGPGGIGVIRASGPAAAVIAGAVFVRARNGAWASHRLYHGHVRAADGRLLDEGLAVLMRAPHSYTGEDVLELHCHGSPVVLDQALRAVLAAGARAATPGEFTKRAFLNGKLDLTQAEAVIDLVRARTPSGALHAAGQLTGHLSHHLSELRRRLIDLKALLEARLDFADEDLDLDPHAPAAATAQLLRDLDTLLATAPRGRLLRDGIRVAIVGRPNAGKSSLLNALLGDDRAIVTDLPGTTRDVIEETADFCGVPVVLSDTAGLRETAEPAERLGVERAHRTAQAADAVLLVIDAAEPPQPADVGFDVDRLVIVLNKVDLPAKWTEADAQAVAGRAAPTVRVSATQGIGLDELRRTVIELFGGARLDGLPALATTRQRDALAKARDALAHAWHGCQNRLPPELVAIDVQAAIDHIGSVTGAVTSEDVLDAIFAQFCIGK
jgi:tRNA modification GTPase